MDTIDRIDPELIPGLYILPEGLLKAVGEDPQHARTMYEELMAAMAGLLPPTQVTTEQRAIGGSNGDVQIVVYQPTDPAPRPGLLWIHGGGYIIGSARDDGNCVAFAEHAGCTIVSVDYRLAPEFTYRASITGCFAALNWMVNNADALGIDNNRIAIGGSSAGGGLTAALALYNRDHGGPEVAFQLLIYPMLDDTHETPSGYEVTYEKVWHRDVSLKAWRMYLGDEFGSDNVSPYGAPARAEDLTGLPRAYVTVGTEDLFRDEDIDYAQRLMAAGVPTELAVFPGMYHSGEVLAPEAAVSQKMRMGYLNALKRALS